ncbi:putative DNA binding domain-containing protein [Candidatus Binatia bacterium]|nr:putative DNA binding domain-containing protein [Candidatus Binatia bacterium]
MPKSVFETVSAFANTRGGWIVLGVTQDGERFEVSGVDEPDKVQNDFLSVLHAGQKVSHDVDVSEHRYEHEGKVVLAFQVAENPRTRKPVYLDGDIRRTFLCRGGGDCRAQRHEIERMLRDASADRWDGEPFTRVDLDEVFHSASLKWYRDRFHATNPGFDVEQPHHEFLYEWGYLVKESGKLLPPRGAVALLGSLRGVRNPIPKPVLDVRFLGYASTEDFDETRWIDRLVSEVNIIETWQQLLAKYLFFMPKTFRDIDPATLERRDAPAGFRVFREAAMNLLIHQDYGDHSRKAVIGFFTDGIEFWNPGDSFAEEKLLLDPGEKDVRNPAIAMAIRRIGMCEQAGTGLWMMQRVWQALGHAPPINTNDRVHKSFATFLAEPRGRGRPTRATSTRFRICIRTAPAADCFFAAHRGQRSSATVCGRFRGTRCERRYRKGASR